MPRVPKQLDMHAFSAGPKDGPKPCCMCSWPPWLSFTRLARSGTFTPSPVPAVHHAVEHKVGENVNSFISSVLSTGLPGSRSQGWLGAAHSRPLQYLQSLCDQHKVGQNVNSFISSVSSTGLPGSRSQGWLGAAHSRPLQCLQ